MIRVLLLVVAASFGQLISRAEELPAKTGGGSGEEMNSVNVFGVHDGILTVETRWPGEKSFIRRMSNGKDVLTVAYGRSDCGCVAGCIKYQSAPDLNRFLNYHSNWMSALQQCTNVTVYKWNWPPIDWNRSWKECTRFLEAEQRQTGMIRRGTRAVRSPRSRRWTALFPESNWCGKGGSGYFQYDFYEATDRCCRQQDNCPGSIGPNEWRYNYYNDRQTAINTCECDSKFRRCLKGTGKISSNTIGRLYFNTLKSECFTVEQVCADRASDGICRSYSPRVKIHEQNPY